MNNRICDMMGIEFPLFAFTHCRDVVVEVSRAGGFGVLGAVGMTPEQLEIELNWIDQHIAEKPYGVDLIVPHKMEGQTEQPTPEEVLAMVPHEYQAFTNGILEAYGIETDDLTDEVRAQSLNVSNNTRLSGAQKQLDVAFSHPIKLIVNALGVPPKIMMEMAKEHGVAVAALMGAKEHAIKHVKAGVDILVVSGTEAGGHCGEVSTMVLVPEIHEAIQPFGDIPILAAGGIVTGRQMAASMAMGATGAWTGSVWLTTLEAETSQVVKEKMLAATSRQTVRSRSRTGKPTRQLRSPWTDAWQQPTAPDPLPMPLQTLVSDPPLAKVKKLAEGGHEGAKELDTYYVGQGVGLMNVSKPAREVVYDFKEDFLKAYERLTNFIDE